MPFPADNLAKLQRDVRLAHVRHAARPLVGGRFEAAYALWRKLYEAQAAVNDQNPGFAAKLLPKKPPLPGVQLGFPLLPTGVRWAVDEAGANLVTVTVELAGTVTWKVTAPDGQPVTALTVATAATRQTLTFPARADGLYHVSARVLLARVAAVLVPVSRVQFRHLRELSRKLGFDFAPRQNPVANADYSELLAVLYAADAAAETNQADLYDELLAIAAAIAPAPTPIALFPRA